MRIKFLSAKEAQEYFKEPDEYAKRLPLSNLRMIDEYNPTIDRYMELFLESFQDFKEDSKKAISKYAEKLKDFNVEIKLVATNRNHSLDITQTRKDVIVVAGGRIGYTTFVHEVYHILSRAYPDLTPKLSSILGFKQIEEVLVKDEKHLLNPDSLFTNYSIELNLDGKKIEAIPYMVLGLATRLMDKEGNRLETKWEDVYGDIFPVTSYTAQPEEICAEYFAITFAGACLFSSSNKRNEIFLKNYKNKVKSILKELKVLL